MHLALVTITLQVLGQTVFRFELSIAQILVAIGTCAAIELVVTFRRDRTIAWPASAMLTGNGIALILRVPGTQWGDWWSLRGWWVFAGCAALGMASKYLIRVGGRHIFNPSNFALVVTFVALGESRADPQVLWWGPLSAGLVIAFLVILTGSVVITRRVGQGHTALSYWFVFAALVAAIAASGHVIVARWHVGPIAGWDYWWLLVTSPEVLVFLFFMITDPKTAPGGRTAQVFFGGLVAGIGALIIATQSGEFGTKVGILAGLVFVSPVSRLLDRRLGDVAGLFGVGIRRAGVLGAGIAATGVAAFVLGGALGADASPEVPLERRSEVGLEDVSLPPVGIDPDAVRSSITLDEELAESMGEATAQDLLIESRALAGADPTLAEAALTGTRLQQALSRIDRGPAAAPEYRFETLTATVMRTSDGPQAPPYPAVHVTGEVTSGGATESLDATFTLVPVQDTWLIDDAFDAQGNPIGPRAGVDPPIEAALDTEGPTPSAELLDGLSFEDVTEAAGLGVDHSDRSLLEGPAASSGGVAVGDFDSDGDPDVFLTRVGVPNALMRNDGGVFEEVTEAAGLGMLPGDTGSTGAAFVDLNGDGILDLVVLGLGSTPNRLWFGSSGGTFTLAGGDWELPVMAPPDADGAMFSLATADYDRDGHVDLFLTADDPSTVLDGTGESPQDAGSAEPTDESTEGGSDDRCAALDRPSRGATGRTVLLGNTGNGFEDRTDRLGVDPGSLVARAATFADVDNDGYDDLLVAGRLCTTSVLINDTEGGFTDNSAAAGVETVHTAHGSSVLDVDGDGNLDWFLTGVSYPTASGECPIDDPRHDCAGNHLLLGNGDGTFRDATGEYGVAEGYWGQGSVAADLNSDGATDLMMTSGYQGVATARPDTGNDPQRPYFEHGVDDPDRLWLNTGAVRSAGLDPTDPATGSTPWPEASATVGLSSRAAGKAAVPLDYDGDGRIDLLVANTNGPPTLWRNTADNPNRWLAVQLHDRDSANTSGVGAVVSVSTADGFGQSQRIGTDGSFQSGTTARAHFGLGPAPGEVAVEIRWPDGSVTSSRITELDRLVVFTKES